MKTRRLTHKPNSNPRRVLKHQDSFQVGDELNPQLIWQIVRRSRVYRNLVDSFIEDFNDHDSSADLEVSNLFVEIAEDGFSQNLLDIRLEGRENNHLQNVSLVTTDETPKFIRDRNVLPSIQTFKAKTNYLIDFPIFYEVEVIPEYYFYFFNFFNPIFSKWPVSDNSANISLNLSLPRKYLLRHLDAHITSIQSKRKKPIFETFKALAPDDFLDQLIIWDLCKEGVPYSALSKEFNLSIADIRRKRHRIGVLIKEFERFISE